MKEITGVWQMQLRHFQDTGTIVGVVVDGDTEFQVKVNPVVGRELVPNLPYRFFGYDSVNTNKHSGKFVYQFRAKLYKMHEPASFIGIEKYLRRYAPGCGLGPINIAALWNAFGADTLKVIRTEPELVWQTLKITKENAERASIMLTKIEALESSRLELTELLAGRGFPMKTVDRAIEKWELLAIETIKTDPFILLVHALPGAGFMRCDKLYLDLGKNPHDLKRQMFAIWHTLNSDRNGNTWMLYATAIEIYRQKITETIPSPEEAVRFGVRDGWLTVVDDAKNIRWITTAKKNSDEENVAASIGRWLHASSQLA